ncbi:hypothetical protein M9H77_01122 [Catharanthus roseus]|uniref:Uncharacterized protein n=1 Tax=Catharanthus roseus TaxID=4058 RepID=A0ACC0C4M2_CATRO|nr:hypothetical protein M9H77_01122 [Catharanthus roseus]
MASWKSSSSSSKKKEKSAAEEIGKKGVTEKKKSGSSDGSGGNGKKLCLCSPTNHPGSFKCSLHRDNNNNVNKDKTSNKKTQTGLSRFAKE